MPYDAVIIGAGPNGLAAAITLARAGRHVCVLEAKETIGGGARTMELTLPGYLHDVCSAIHPLGVGSPFMRSVPLEEHGVEWIHPEIPVAHPFDDGSAAALYRSVERTAAGFRGDTGAYLKLIEPLARNWHKLADDLLAPFGIPRHPLLMARFGLNAVRPAAGFIRSTFATEKARGFFAGLAAHSIMPLENPTTAAFGMVLAMFGHGVGWPFPKGGSQKIVDALASYLKSLGGEIRTMYPVSSMDDIPPTKQIYFDLTPRQVLAIVGERFPQKYRERLGRYRYGPGVFKLDIALDGPIPWIADECRRAGTVHLGGPLEQVSDSERMMFNGQHAERPFVLLAQHSQFDPTRAPEGKQTVWAYCHVPHGSTVDMTDAIEAQIERFAPGFRDRILARHTMNTAEIERYNPNYIGGDINGGVQDIRQLFTRPLPQLNPYATPLKNVFICSSSTPPGGGVHGMCGNWAAKKGEGRRAEGKDEV